MNIETVIPLRKDGTVKITAPSGATYTFAPDDEGRVIHAVEDQGDIAWLLAIGDFFPADEGDFHAALDMGNAAPIEGEGEAPPDDDAPDMNAAPIEEPAKKKKGK